jgi:hypothetical protein
MSENQPEGLAQCLRCNAKSKRSGVRCNSPAVKGKIKCRMHGGTSKGPSEAGKQRLSDLKMVHGNYTREDRRNTARYAEVIRSARAFIKNRREVSGDD